MDDAGVLAAQPAIVGESIEISYAALRALSVTVAVHMQMRGVRQGATVAVQTNDVLAALATIFAAGLIGARWVRATDQLAERQPVAVNLWLHTLESGAPKHPDSVLIGQDWAAFPAEHPQGTRPQFTGPASLDDGWLIAATSGTTGTAKHVELSHRMIHLRTMSVAQDFAPAPRRMACLFPVTAFPFIMRALTTLANKGTLVHSYSPGYWARANTDIVMGSPSQVRELFKDIALRNKLPALHVGGTRISDDEADALLHSFQTVVDVYGSTEANQVIRRTIRHDAQGKMISDCQTLQDADIEIVDDADGPRPAGQDGIVRIRAPWQVQAYLDSPESAARAFRNGWFYPGDIGHLDAQNCLQIQGRENDMFNIGGVKINAVKLDLALRSVTGIRDAISFALPDKKGVVSLYAFVDVDPAASAQASTAAASAAAARLLGSGAKLRNIFTASDLPRLSGGKPDRIACQHLALARRDMLN